MAAQSHTHVYMEMLETSANTLQESTTMWHPQMAGMAVGKHPKGILAHCSQPDTDTSHINGEPETSALSHTYGILRETASALRTAVCRTARTVV